MQLYILFEFTLVLKYDKEEYEEEDTWHGTPTIVPY
jgi:hypothetical protein